MNKVANAPSNVIYPRDLPREAGMSRTTAWRLVRAEKMPPPIKLGSRIFWLRADLDAWLADLKSK